MDPEFYKSAEFMSLMNQSAKNRKPPSQAELSSLYNSWKANQQIQQRYSDVTNFNSPLYKQYADYLRKTTPSIGVNTLMSPLSAGGYDPTSAKNIAQNRATQLQATRNQGISTAVQSFALNNQSQATGLLGLYSQNQQFQQQLAQQNEQYQQNRSDSFLNSVIGLGGGLLANYLMPGSGALVNGNNQGTNSFYSLEYGYV